MARRSADRAATRLKPWASDAVVAGTPALRNRESNAGAGYASSTGLNQPADDTSAAMPDDAAASAMRSYHSSGTAGRRPLTFARSGWASTSQTPEPASSSNASVYASHTDSIERESHSASTTGFPNWSKPHAPTQCTEPNRTSNG